MKNLLRTNFLLTLLFLVVSKLTFLPKQLVQRLLDCKMRLITLKKKTLSMQLALVVRMTITKVKIKCLHLIRQILTLIVASAPHGKPNCCHRTICCSPNNPTHFKGFLAWRETLLVASRLRTARPLSAAGCIRMQAVSGVPRLLVAERFHRIEL